MSHPGAFGSCCSDLEEVMKTLPNSMFHVEDNGVLYLTVAHADTEQGPGWFDRAIIFCPFCGKQLQTNEEIAAKSAAK
jgi:hypothetical protein